MGRGPGLEPGSADPQSARITNYPILAFGYTVNL